MRETFKTVPAIMVATLPAMEMYISFLRLGAASAFVKMRMITAEIFSTLPLLIKARRLLPRCSLYVPSSRVCSITPEL